MGGGNTIPCNLEGNIQRVQTLGLKLLTAGSLAIIDQLWRERLSHEYHYLPFWWSKLPVVIARHVLDNEAINIETH